MTSPSDPKTTTAITLAVETLERLGYRGYARVVREELERLSRERNHFAEQASREEEAAMQAHGLLADVTDALWGDEERAATHAYDGVVERAHALRVVAEVVKRRPWATRSPALDRALARLEGRRPEPPDPVVLLHPQGRCTCGSAGDGDCTWCRQFCSGCGALQHDGECGDGPPEEVSHDG